MTRRFLIITLFMVLNLSFVPNSLAPANNEQDAFISATQHGTGISTYVTGAWNVSYSTLRALVGADEYMNYGNFCRIIEQYFVPFNQRIVGLFVGWEQHANTSTTDIPYYRWVDDWLSACDQYAIENFFYFGQWGISSPAPSWWNDVLEAYPDVRSYDKMGLPVSIGKANPVSIDHPQLIEQYKEDLKQLWEYYGEHPSWIGWGGFPGDFACYTRTDAGVSNVGFANYSITNFAKTIYYLRDVNETGFHNDGTKCKVWEAFVEYEPLTVFGWGTWQDSDDKPDVHVYGGTGKGGRLVAMKFTVPENMTGFKIRWYGRRIGQPPIPLVLELYIDKDDAPHNIGNPIESVIQPIEEIGTSPSWQTPVSFVSNLVKDKHYWIVFRTIGGDNSNKYILYRRDYKTDESSCKVSKDGYSLKDWIFRGSAVLCIQNADGVDKKIYPRQWVSIGINQMTNLNQPFTPTENIFINTVFLHVADRMFDETPSTLQIVRVSDGTVLSSGLLDQKSISGLWRWVPVLLDKRIELRAGIQYSLSLRSTLATPWQWHRLNTDPPSQGFQGQSKAYMFRLADMDFSALKNFMRCNMPTATGRETGLPGITETNWYAVRFKPTIGAPLSVVDVKIEKYGEPADLTIAIRADYDGNGSRPAKTDLESKTVAAANVSEGMSWISTANWTTPLTAGNWYWIVFSMGGSAVNSGYRILQTVNPIEYKLMWTADSGISWGKGREVAELIFKVATAAEVFKAEPEDAQFAEGQTKIGNEYLMAQSFSPTSDITAKGLLLYIIRATRDPGENLNVDLRADSGADTPSLTTLTSGTLSFKSATGEGLQYVDFEFPLPLTPNEKYWIVLRSTQDARVYCPYYLYREPEDSFGGTDYKAKRSRDGGFSWHLPQDREADIIFAVVESSVISDHKSYGTADLSADIAHYHANEITVEPLRGWNTYLNLQTSKILKETTEWFERYTGRQWYSIDNNPVPIIEEAGGSKNLSKMALGAVGSKEVPPSNSLFFFDSESKLSVLLKSGGINVYPWSSWGHFGNHMGRITPEQIGAYYRTTLPLLSRAANFFDWDPTGLMNDTQQKWSRGFGEILNRMRYSGGYYGSEKGTVNALFIGERDIGVTLQFLTAALNVTLYGFPDFKGDYNLTKLGDFRQFDVIVWWTKGPNMWDLRVTKSVEDRIKMFVKNGGGLIVTNAWPNWVNPILGFDCRDAEISLGNIDFVDYRHPILKPYTNISGYSYYWRDRKVIPYEADPGAYVVRDTNGVPWISEHTYGNGTGVFIGMPSEFWSKLGAGTNGSPRESYLVLLNNAIFYAARKETMLPTWWFTDYETPYLPWHTQLWYSINGKPGEPVLLWLTNNGNATSFEIHLNATFYGIDPKGWVAIDVLNWKPVAKGTGTDIKINVTIPKKSWKPIYVWNQATDTHDIYSNISVLKRVTSPIQIVYTLQALYRQTSWLIINSTQSVKEVRFNEEIFLPRHTSITSLNASETLAGWFYDQADNLLYLKFKSTNTINIVRISLKTALPLSQQYLYLIPISAVVVVATIEVVVWFRRRRKEKLS